jgi:hypothetical protein
MALAIGVRLYDAARALSAPAIAQRRAGPRKLAGVLVGATARTTGLAP